VEEMILTKTRTRAILAELDLEAWQWPTALNDALHNLEPRVQVRLQVRDGQQGELVLWLVDQDPDNPVPLADIPAVPSRPGELMDWQRKYLIGNQDLMFLEIVTDSRQETVLRRFVLPPAEL